MKNEQDLSNSQTTGGKAETVPGITIIYAKVDENEAREFSEHLQSEVLISEKCKTITMLDDTQMGKLEEASQHSLFVFLFLTKSFCEDSWPRVSQEDCIRNSLYGTDTIRVLVPIFTKSRSTADFKIPFGINILKGLRYCDRDDFYKASVLQLLFKWAHDTSWYCEYEEAINFRMIKYVIYFTITTQIYTHSIFV